MPGDSPVYQIVLRIFTIFNSLGCFLLPKHFIYRIFLFFIFYFFADFKSFSRGMHPPMAASPSPLLPPTIQSTHTHTDRSHPSILLRRTTSVPYRQIHHAFATVGVILSPT